MRTGYILLYSVWLLLAYSYWFLFICFVSDHTTKSLGNPDNFFLFHLFSRLWGCKNICFWRKKKKYLAIPSLLRILISNKGWFFFPPKLLFSLSGDQMVFTFDLLIIRHYTNSCSSIQNLSSVPLWNKPNLVMVP